MGEFAGEQGPGQQPGGEAPPEGGMSVSGQPEGGSGQAGGQSPEPGSVSGEGSPASPPEPVESKTPEGFVPYATFREARTRGTQSQREYEQAKAQWDEERQGFETKATEAQAAHESSQEMQDYRFIRDLLQRNPDLYQMLEQRARELGGHAGLGGSGNGAAATKVELPPEFKELSDTTKQLAQRLHQQEEREQQQREAAKHRDTEQKLEATVTKFLGEKNYGQEMAGMALDYILSKSQDPAWAGMDFTDVPHILNEWYGLMERGYEARNKALLDGKREDGKLPPSPGAAQTPVRGAPSTDGDTTRNAMLEGLKRMGWGG